MKDISNIKRVRGLIKERTSNKKLLTIITFTFATLIIISALSNFHFTNTVKAKFLDFSSYILGSLYTPINTFKNSGENINNIFNVYSNNKKLLLENEILKSYPIENKVLLAENLELRRLLNLKTHRNKNFVTAEVISQNNFSFLQSIILSAGKDDKIILNSPVVYNNNLIGHISELGNKSSRVTLITDINSKVPAMILNKDIKLIVSGDNSSFLKVLNYGNLDMIEGGEEIYTSGDGDMYPSGLLIGKVIINKNGDYFVQTGTNINKLNYVEVIDWSSLARGIDIKSDGSN